MQLMALLAAAELVLGLLAAGGSSRVAQKSDRASRTHFLAQASDATDVSNPDTNAGGGNAAAPASDIPAEGTDSSQPGDQSAPPADEQPVEQQPQEQPPADQPSDQSTQPGEQTPGEQPGEQSVPEPEELIRENQNPEIIEQLSPAQEADAISPGEALSSEEAASIQQSASASGPEEIDPRAEEKTAQEESALVQTATAQEETSLLIQFADEKINDINDSLDANDAATADYAVGRMNSQIDDALANIGSLAPEQSRQLKEKIIALAEKAEPELRAAQLIVPEDMEQDFEIARGKLLNIEELK